MSQQLILELSTGSILSKNVKIVNLDTFHKGLDGDVPVSAVALWHRAALAPEYFAHGSPDAEAIKVWADTQLGEQFLRMSSMLFAVDTIEIAMLDDHGNATVKIEDDPLLFVFPGNVIARLALLLWAGEATLPRQAVQV